MFGMKRRDRQVKKLWAVRLKDVQQVEELTRRVSRAFKKAREDREGLHVDINKLVVEVTALRRDLDLLLERTGYKPVHCEQDYWYLESMPESVP